MHGVAERIEDRRDVEVDPRVVVPDVGHRQGDVLGERTRPIDADARGLGAQMAPARHAVAAPSAHDVPLAADPVTRPLAPAFFIEGTYKGRPATILVTTSASQPDRVDLWVFPRDDCSQVLATEQVR